MARPRAVWLNSRSVLLHAASVAGGRQACSKLIAVAKRLPPLSFLVEQKFHSSSSPPSGPWFYTSSKSPSAVHRLCPYSVHSSSS